MEIFDAKFPVVFFIDEIAGYYFYAHTLFSIMTSTKQISKHFRDVYFGGNWTSVNLKDTLADVNWEQATTKVHHLNTIAVLVFHINYYVSAILKVLQGKPLQASDKFSFDLHPITAEDAWQELVTKTFTEAEQLALLMENLDEAILFHDFADPKYGNYYRNLLGVIEHTHYHLGQIVLIKKIINEKI
ncbi:DUF1572 domain-containing protein [Chitinophaga sp. MM2321]|uniref:DUF1572 domain-containing protein n=1 Tax=Chitinophaga sp. MM2321 TaxID=3137178 RepID=UPI0032D56D94